MTPRIVSLSPKQLIGMHVAMSYAHNRTGELWRSFMPRRNEIKHLAGSDLVSMQVYPTQMDFENLNPILLFDKWATVEVTLASDIPDGMELFNLPGGLYAVFDYKGSSNDAAVFFQYVFGTWLPASEYEIDNRPHFELLGSKYKNNDPESEEEVWVPIRKRS